MRRRRSHVFAIMSRAHYVSEKAGCKCRKIEQSRDAAANLADDFKPALLLGFCFSPQRGRELQHRCNLTFGEEGEQYL
jgi:hypothetical protein